jgi:GDA1/CD39 (nucleoside phosphatase) family
MVWSPSRVPECSAKRRHVRRRDTQIRRVRDAASADRWMRPTASVRCSQHPGHLRRRSLASDALETVHYPPSMLGADPDGDESSMLPRPSTAAATNRSSKTRTVLAPSQPDSKPKWFRRRNLFLALACLVVLVWLAARRRPDLVFRPKVVHVPAADTLVPSTGGQLCLPPSDGSSPTRYALMVDAGSTGSRIHVYRFRMCASGMPRLEYETFHSLQPGLSSYAADPRGAADSLRPLLEAAVAEIPERERTCTPISVKATAGLRLLGEHESREIVRHVESSLREEWPFTVVGPPGSGKGVGIMDGKDEGVYAWITINYVRTAPS